MAYAYPNPEHAMSSSSLAGLSRKGSETFDLLGEFRHKIEEDENYVGFFSERIRVEEMYIENLQKLYDKAKAVDSLHDDVAHRGVKSTSRRAWEEVRDYTSREIQSREAMISALKEDVLKDLARLREEQNRIMIGLKDNTRLSKDMYEEHAKNQLPKLKRNYWSKCQAVEDHKRQEHAIQMQAKLLSTPSPTSPASTPSTEHPNAFNYISKPELISPPSVNPPLPPSSNPAAAGLADTPSFNHPQSQSISFASSLNSHTYTLKHNAAVLPNRHRSGSGPGGKDVLNDFATQSKKGFNAIMQKLGGDKGEKEKEGDLVVVGGGNGGGLGDGDGGGGGLQRRGTARGDPSRGMGTMRGVKVKREADEADKAYRLGVFHLESLRLRREKLHSSAVSNLDTFNDELNRKLKIALERYIDVMHGTAATNAQGTEVTRHALTKVNVDHDTMLFRATLRSMDNYRTASVPYHNFYVGECRSLIYGVSLTDYDFARGEGSDHGRPPVVVEKCIAAIDEKGLEMEGIYRISGRHASVQKMIQDIERDEERYVFDEKDDIFSISNVLKQYLRELPEPVFPLPHAERVKLTREREIHVNNSFSALRARLRRLPPIHQTTFRAIIEHLGRVQSRSGQNKMDAKNLAVVFNSVIFGQDQVPADGNVMNMHLEKDTILEDLITYSDLLFDAQSPPQAAEALPNAPGPSRTHNGNQPGSSRTKMEIVNAPETTSNGSSDPAYPEIRMDDQRVAGFEERHLTLPDARFTPDLELELLFDPQTIPSGMREAAGESYHVRPLSSSDLMRSHFGLLATLTISPPIAPSVYKALFNHLKSCSETYFITVVIDRKTDQMVAHGTLFLERKYIHGGSTAGHIEDIVVSPDVRKSGLGKTLVQGLRDMGIGLGCYKVILDCKEDRVPFYEKCGFHLRAREMAYYHSNNDISPGSTPGLHPTPTTHLPSTRHGSSLALPGPGLRSAPALPPRKQQSLNVTEREREREQEAESIDTGSPGSSTSGITYQYPVDGETDTGNIGGSGMPSWTGEGLGNVEVKSPVVGRGLSLVSPERRERPVSPLPPGAAPA